MLFPASESFFEDASFQVSDSDDVISLNCALHESERERADSKVTAAGPVLSEIKTIMQLKQMKIVYIILTSSVIALRH